MRDVCRLLFEYLNPPYVLAQSVLYNNQAINTPYTPFSSFTKFGFGFFFLFSLVLFICWIFFFLWRERRAFPSYIYFRDIYLEWNKSDL